MTSITINISLAWWVRPYLYGVALFAFLTFMDPDIDKVTKVVLRGVRVSS